MLKKSEVRIGGVYVAKVTDRLVQVRIDSQRRGGGWHATNLATGKKIVIKSAQRLRSAVEADSAETGAEDRDPHENPDRPQEANTTRTVPNTGEGDATPAAEATTCLNGGGLEEDEAGDCAQCHEPNNVGKATKKARSKKVKSDKPKRPSGLDAAAKVLEETGVAMNVKEIAEVARTKGYWKPAGRTPSATLAAALIREIVTKGADSRFRKSERGKFVLNR